MAFELPFPPFPHDSRDVPFIATPDDENGYAVPSSQYFKKLVGDKYIWTPVSADDPLPTSDATMQTRIGEVQAVPTANTLLARLKSLEDKIDEITAGTTPAVTTLSGRNVTIGAATFAMSGGDTLRGKSADKPTAAAAHEVIPYCFYFSIDTGVVEATDGTSWVVI